MGDRYELELYCAYCNELNIDIWFAPTCGSNGFLCSKCKKYNYIKNFHSIKKEDITADDLFNEFMDATNVGWNEKDVKRIKQECERELK